MVNLAFSHLLDRVAIMSLWGFSSSLVPFGLPGVGIAMAQKLCNRINQVAVYPRTRFLCVQRCRVEDGLFLNSFV